MFDFNDPWFKPLWRRVLVALLTLGWGLFELISGSPGWSILFLALGGYASYRLFLVFEPRD